MTAATNVGSIEARLRLNRDEWRRSIAEAREEARSLTGINPEIRIRVNTASVISDLEAIAAAQRRLANSSTTGSAALRRETEQVGLLGNAIRALAPAAVPLAGATLAAGSAFVALGVSGLLAVRGIKAEMKAGSNVGVAYAGQIQVAKNALTTLQTTAATNFLGGFEASVDKLSTRLPAFNVAVGQSSTVLGDIAQHLAGGLTAGFTTFEPTITSAEQGLDKLAAKFEDFASTADGARFAQSLSGDFQQVVPLVEHVAVALGHVITAAAPIGGSVVTVLDDLSEAIDHIPVPALTALGAALSTLGTARLVSGLLGARGLAGSLAGVGAESAGAARGVGLLGAGLGRVVPYIAAAVAAGVAFKSLDNATLSWATSTNKLEFAVHQTAKSFGELFTGHPLDFASDAFGKGADQAQTYRHYVLDVQNAVNGLTAPSAKAKTSLGGIPLGGLAGLKAYSAELEQVQKNLSSRDLSFVDPKTASSNVTTGHGSVAGAAAGPTQGEVLRLAYTKELGTELQRLSASQTNFATAAAHSTSISSLSGVYTTQATALQKVADSQLKTISSGQQLEGPAGTYHGVKIGIDGMSDALAKFNGNVPQALGYIHAQIDGYSKTAAAAASTAAQSQRLGDVVGSTAAKYKLGAEQIDLYAQVAGISATQVASGAISQAQFASAIGLVATAVRNGDSALTGYVTAIAAFNKSGQTAGDVGQLIGATLKAANGPLLAYQNTLVQTAVAGSQFRQDLEKATKGVLNLQTGMLNTHRAGAAPLLNDLSNLQTAAVNSAAATYQLETSQGKASAASDAFAGYVRDTKGALEQQFVAAGKTKGEADKLAGVYFNIKNSSDLKKQIELLGGNQVQAALKGILTDLDILAGKKTLVQVIYEQRNVGKAPVGQTGSAGGSHARANAAGTFSAFGQSTIPPNTSFTVGEGADHTWEYGVTDSQGRASIYSNSQAKAMGVPTPRAYAAGTGGSSAKTTPTELKGLSSAAGSLLAAARNTNASAADVRAATAQLKASAKAAHEGAAAIAAAGRIQAQINTKAAERQKLANQLGTAPTAPTLYERLADAKNTRAQDAGSFAAGISGGFDITTAGLGGPTAGKVTSQAGATITTTTPGGSGVTLGKLIGDSDAAVAQAKEYDRLLRKLANEGLDKTELLELAGKSPADGLPVARELAKATPAQIRHLAANQNTITQTGASLGGTLAQRFDGAGVSLIQGLIAGVKSQQKTLDSTIEQLAQGMIDKFRDKLKIKSPSRLTHEIGAYVGDGLANGMVERIPHVTNAAGRLAGAAVPNVNGPSKGAAAGGGTGAPPIVQHIYPQPGQSPREIGRAAGDELRWVLST